MKITYTEFMKTVPTETQQFVDSFLKLIQFYFERNNSLQLKDEYSISSSFKLRSLALLALDYSTDSQEIKQFLGAAGFNPNVVKQKHLTSMEQDLPVSQKEEIFNKYAENFCVRNTKSGYNFLTPTDIIALICKKMSDRPSYSVVDLFKGLSEYNTFLSNLEKYNRAVEDQALNRIRMDFFEDLDMSVINYLEKASIIYGFLKTKIENEEQNKSLNITVEEADTLALLMALNYEPNLTAQLLAKENVLPDAYQKYLKLQLPQDIMNHAKPSICWLKDVFSEFVFQGCNRGVERKDITIDSIAKNLFNRKLNNSLIIERILTNSGTTIERFRDFDKLIADIKVDFETGESDRKRLKFYSSLDSKTIDFVEFLGKTYDHIIEKMNNGEGNKDLLKSEDDADTLALLISSYFFNNDVVQFFVDHNITLPEILEFAGISVSFDEVDARDSNVDTLIKKYERYVFDGINKGKNAKDVTIDSILRNLCNTTFNRSLIINQTLKEFSKDTVLPDDFLSVMEKHIVEKEKERVRGIEDKTFKDCDYTAINYLKTSSIVFQFIKKEHSNLDDSVAEAVSLFLGLYFTDSKSNDRARLLEFFAHNNVTSQKVSGIVNESKVKKFMESVKPNVDVIIQHLAKYMPAVSIESPKQIGIYDIAKGIFNGDTNYSSRVKEMLGSFDSDYSYFADFDSRYKAYGEQKKAEAERKERDELYKGMNPKSIAFVQHLDDVHKTLESNLENNSVNDNFNYDKGDIPYLTTFISLLLSKSKITEFMEHNQINLSVILGALGLSNINEDKEVDTNTILQNYNRLLRYKEDTTVEAIAKNLFTIMPIDNIVSVLLTSLGYDYNNLKNEILEGKIITPPLSDEEHLGLLRNRPIPQLTDTVSPLETDYGKVLDTHSQFIADKMMEVGNVGRIADSLEKLSEASSKIVVVKENPQPTGLRAFFSRGNAPAATKTINIEALREYSDQFEEQVEQLDTQLEGYRFIQKYLGVVMDKTRGYVVSLNEEMQSLQTQLDACKLDGTVSARVEQIDLIGRIAQIKSRMDSYVEALNIKAGLLNQASTMTINNSRIVERLRILGNDSIPHYMIGQAIAEGLGTQSTSIEMLEKANQGFGKLIRENNQGMVATNLSITNLEANPNIFTLESILAESPTLIKDPNPVLAAQPLEQSQSKPKFMDKNVTSPTS